MTERGSHVLDAAVGVVAEGGLDALSMRTVAATAGVSLAQVQYYFGSKEQLMAATFEHVASAVERAAIDIDVTGEPGQVLRAMLELWLPIDQARARQVRVWLAFTAAAATSRALASVAAELDRELRSGFAELLRSAQESGAVAEAADIDAEASLLLAMVDGLVVQALMLPERRRRRFLERGLRAYLSRLLPDTDTMGGESQR